jgi:ribonuclease E
MLFNATQSEELRVAIVDGQKLIDLDIETQSKMQKKGNIYKGSIVRIEPSLEACFVNYGGNRHGFLPFKEVSKSYFENYSGGRAKIQDVLKEGMSLLVQVEKDERGNKGAALTTFVSLAGRYLVLMPNNPRGGGVSRRIEGEERQELKEILSGLDVPDNMSVIARTAGIGRNAEELKWDLAFLLKLWRACESASETFQTPKLIMEESNLVIRAIRDYFQPDIGEILIDTDAVFEDASQFVAHMMPQMLPRLRRYRDHVPLFSRYQIEYQIECAFSRTVDLPSGGAIVIDHTEALVSIDVNSARSTKGGDIEETALRTNLEAAEEVARQMRLRDLGGLIVIDFIDMENQKNQREVEAKLAESLRPDRARVQRGKLSRFGLLELSRQRLRPSLGENSHESCPRCSGTGFIRGTQSSALHILRLIQDAAMKEGTGAVHIQVPVDVATFLLNEKRNDIYAVETRQRVHVVLIPNSRLETPHYKITRIRTDDMDAIGDAPSYLRFDDADLAESSVAVVKERLKAEEPAVKGLAPATPAPVRASNDAMVSVVASIKSFFTKLFTTTPKKTAHQDKNRRHTNDLNRNRRAKPVSALKHEKGSDVHQEPRPKRQKPPKPADQDQLPKVAQAVDSQVAVEMTHESQVKSDGVADSSNKRTSKDRNRRRKSATERALNVDEKMSANDTITTISDENLSSTVALQPESLAKPVLKNVQSDDSSAPSPVDAAKSKVDINQVSHRPLRNKDTSATLNEQHSVDDSNVTIKASTATEKPEAVRHTQDAFFITPRPMPSMLNLDNNKRPSSIAPLTSALGGVFSSPPTIKVLHSTTPSNTLAATPVRHAAIVTESLDTNEGDPVNTMPLADAEQVKEMVDKVRPASQPKLALDLEMVETHLIAPRALPDVLMNVTHKPVTRRKDAAHGLSTPAVLPSDIQQIETKQ